MASGMDAGFKTQFNILSPGNTFPSGFPIKNCNCKMVAGLLEKDIIVKQRSQTKQKNLHTR